MGRPAIHGEALVGVTIMVRASEAIWIRNNIRGGIWNKRFNHHSLVRSLFYLMRSNKAQDLIDEILRRESALRELERRQKEMDEIPG